MKSTGVRVVATLVAKAGKAAELSSVLHGLIEPTRAEAGCRHYELWQNEADEHEFRFVEEWDSDEALAAHLQTPHIMSGRGRMPELLDGEMDLRKYRIVGEVAMSQESSYLEPTQELGRTFVQRGIEGSVVMLNLLRFREIADYSATPELAPKTPISGEEAYRLYMEHALPYVREAGGELIFLGKGGRHLIGPPEDRWDVALLVRQKSVAAFMAFAADEEYLAGLGHRTAALADSRLLPLVEDA